MWELRMKHLSHVRFSNVMCYVSKSFAFVVMTLVTLSCSDSSRAAFLLEPEQRLHSLDVNFPAVNLALVAPYDTVTLTAVARNALGMELPDTIPVTFSTNTTQIAVTPNGFVRAVSQTSSSGVTITAAVTYHGVTVTANTQVVVTKVAQPPIMHSFSFGLPDTIEIGPVEPFGKFSAFMPVAKTNGGEAISRVIYAYQSSDKSVVVAGTDPYARDVWSAQTSEFQLMPMQKTDEFAVIRAKARVYGVTMTDSFVVNVHKEHNLVGIILYDTMTTTPRDVELHHGGDVYWINTSPVNELGIVFDQPDEAKSPNTGTLISLLTGWSPDSGNIAPFIRDTIVSPGDTLPIIPHRSMVRGRSFPNPGRYRWQTTRTPSVAGTIIVR